MSPNQYVFVIKYWKFEVLNKGLFVSVNGRTDRWTDGQVQSNMFPQPFQNLGTKRGTKTNVVFILFMRAAKAMASLYICKV